MHARHRPEQCLPLPGVTSLPEARIYKGGVYFRTQNGYLPEFMTMDYAAEQLQPDHRAAKP